MDDKDRLIRTCRVCDSHNVKYLCDTYNEHSKTTTIHNYKCHDCGSVYVGNEIESEELGVAYATLNSRKYYEEIELENRKKMATAIRHLQQLISKNDSIIDIGTGNGSLIHLLKEAGFENVSAHEIQGNDLSSIEQIVSHVYQDFDYSSIPSCSFDAVTLLDVAEHVIDPRYLMSMCHRILKIGGVIYFHTPVVTRTDRLMHFFLKVPVLKKAGAIWQRGRTSIFHLENYTPKSLTHLLENADFDEITIEVKNELSWPITRYIRVFLLEKQGLPGFLAPLFVPFLYPFLGTNLFNPNKAIVIARKGGNLSNFSQVT